MVKMKKEDLGALTDAAKKFWKKENECEFFDDVEEVEADCFFNICNSLVINICELEIEFDDFPPGPPANS